MAIRSKMSLTNEFKMAIALFEIPVSGWTCLRTGTRAIRTGPKLYRMNSKTRTLVDVGGVGLLPGLSPLLLSVRIGRRGSLGSLLRLGLRSGFGGSLGGGRGGGLSGGGRWFGWHFWRLKGGEGEVL